MRHRAMAGIAVLCQPGSDVRKPQNERPRERLTIGSSMRSDRRVWSDIETVLKVGRLQSCLLADIRFGVEFMRRGHQVRKRRRKLLSCFALKCR